jgi:hypothetical protein
MGKVGGVTPQDPSTALIGHKGSVDSLLLHNQYLIKPSRQKSSGKKITKYYYLLAGSPYGVLDFAHSTWAVPS